MATRTFKCSLITPAGVMFDGVADSVVAPGAQGRFGVLAGHEPMVTILKKGVLVIGADGKENFYAIDSGVLEVDLEHQVAILADNALTAQSEAAAKQRLSELASPAA